MNQIPEIETLAPENIKLFQEERLRKTLGYLAAHSPFYKTHFKEHKINVSAIKTMRDLLQVPPTTKDQLQRNNPDFVCVPRNKIVEYTTTSGTLGKPVTVPLTEGDLQRLAYNESLSFACADGSPTDVYQLMLTLDRQFMAGIAYYEGIRKLGGGVIRVGPGMPATQWEIIERLRPTTLVAVPSFIVKLLEFAKDHNIDPNNTSVRKAICIGESLRQSSFELNVLGKRIIADWSIQLYSTYASTEMQTAFTECSHGVGGHHHPELIIAELLDENDQPVQQHIPGELTITTLGVEGMPLLRYKTGDMVLSYHEPCQCGRTTMRIGPVLGRKQQLIKLKGTTIYPPGIFEILNDIDMVKDFVVEAFTNNLGTDEIKLHIVVSDMLKEQAEKKLVTLFQSRLRVVPELNFITQPELEKLQIGMTDRKLRRFIDLRG